MTTPGATWHITVVDETGSTNVDLLAAAAEGAPDRSVLMALHQTAGRGRLDRRWSALPAANLLVSLLFREVPEHPHQLTQRVALAAARACAAVAGVTPELKWPNDLLIGGRKLAGVLAQAGGSGPDQRPAYVVVGIGLNVRWAPDDAARLDERIEGIEPRAVLDAMLAAFDELPAGSTEIGELYRSSLATLGQAVRVELAGSSVSGRALDVLADGRLVVLDECGISHRFDTGDVVHLR